MENLTKRLRTVSDMINLGEKISWGQETSLMDEAATCIDRLERELSSLQARHEAILEWYEIMRPANEWHEDDGPVLWWHLPVSEPPYCGTPLDTDFPTISGEQYHTHFTMLTRNEVLRDADRLLDTIEVQSTRDTENT